MGASSSTDIERIRALDREGLLELWTSILDGSTESDGWLQGKAFEYLVLRAFELEDAVVQWPFTVRLGEEIVEEVDGAVHLGGFACICESKDRRERINVEPLAKLRNQLLRRPAAAIGLVFSRSGFTEPAIALARYVAPQTLLLWNGDEIDFALRECQMVAGLQAKYRHAVEQGLPDFDIRLMK